MRNRTVFIILFFASILKINAVDFNDLSGKNFELSFFDSISGDFIDIEELDSKVLVVHFWYSECSPCNQATPILQELYKKYHVNNFEIIGVCVDRNKDNFIKYCDENQMIWPQYFDSDSNWDESLALKCEVAVLPMFIIINKDNIIVKNTYDVNEIEKEINKLLEQ